MKDPVQILWDVAQFFRGGERLAVYVVRFLKGLADLFDEDSHSKDCLDKHKCAETLRKAAAEIENGAAKENESA